MASCPPLQWTTKTSLTNGPSPISEQTYDGNGNLLTGHNGKWVYTYDDENRLIEWASYAHADPEFPVAGDLVTLFVYDGLGRLRQRFEYHYDNSGGTLPNPGGGEGLSFDPGSFWILDSETRYIYDGMRVIQERSGTTPSVSYTRGNDLSGTLEGAGGIGGLLARSHGYSSGNWSTHNFYHADGNGNITYMVNSSQTAAATYRYDPFGNLISSSGTLANANTYRFSSKELHANSGMYYYLYRFYDPNLQRWLNRDPAGEAGFELLESKRLPALGDGPNLYTFVRNDSVSWWDPVGLKRDCNKENIECNRRCMKKRCPFETRDDTPEVNKWKRVAFCEAKCQAEYMACMKENDEEERRDRRNDRWLCQNHPWICVGVVVVVIVVVVQPELAPVLAPVAL